MNIEPVQFSIQYPISLFSKDTINFDNQDQRTHLFKRNLYYFTSGNDKNEILEQRADLFLRLGKNVRDYVISQHPQYTILSVSIFGSALHSPSNDDFDFLVIVSGSAFSNFQTTLFVEDVPHSVGISIKGEQNLSRGEICLDCTSSQELQMKIINRTSISLPYRHLPLLGSDFKENKETFLTNLYAQIYDLLINSYNGYYLSTLANLPPVTRVRKMLSRMFEASKYGIIISPEFQTIQREILDYRSEGKHDLDDCKRLFEKFVLMYNVKFKKN